MVIDPSFRMARKLSGQLTWGVCRPDVRNEIQIGDMVVFISCRRSIDLSRFSYRLCSIATVSSKVRATEIRKSRSLRLFKDIPTN